VCGLSVCELNEEVCLLAALFPLLISALGLAYLPVCNARAATANSRPDAVSTFISPLLCPASSICLTKDLI
jgi:hypothetical protein